ncbi:YPO3983 family protein [Serratia sp. UGAL515B_01]|uniref:YPO3983 family protein n=1 Tax=Serratia sp. UGAL515B_01 TaxID=2986763 RepID=UPI0029530D10|nr:YPO3983 family protein [Serratia sp. UGAL515B_01]WON76498.1 DUF3289 family protein [Serratia sp. UGAL515B_01]
MSETSQPIPQALRFPCTVFRTQKRMDDYAADDMRYADLSAMQLKTDFKLNSVSSKVDPYTLTLFKQLKPRAYGYDFKAETNFESNQKITRQECANILFDEFRKASQTFAVYGPYKSVMGKMIDHMQNGNGAPFRDMLLNAALKEQILSDTSNNSTYLLIKEALNKYIDWENRCYPVEKQGHITDAVFSGRLPKFDRPQDLINGLGITVHDTYATHITIKSLQIDNDRYRAVVHYNVQDHFGLDNDNIIKFRSYNIFRIWFVLQRFNQFGYKPFMTNMEATLEIIDERNERKKQKNYLCAVTDC